MPHAGSELGGNVTSGAPLTVQGPENDPVAAAYRWYTGYNKSRFSWDPLTVVHPNGSNAWVYDETVTDQHWLRLKVDNETAAQELDRLFLEGAASAA